MPPLMPASGLSAEELQLCKKAFNQFDTDQSGAIDTRELKQVLDSMGQHCSDEELFAIIHDVDEDSSGEIDFAEFCKVILKHKQASAQSSDEGDTEQAWVALGGSADKSGKICSDKLRQVLKEFSLTIIDIDRLIREVDYDSSGFLSYADFKRLLA